jgi:putative addiction module component (TIGR02574 family)
MKFPPADPVEIRLAEIRAFIDTLNFFERNEVRDQLARLGEFTIPLSQRGQELVTAILDLDWPEQAAVVEKIQLIHGRPPGVMSGDDPRFPAELERRIEDLKSGKVKGIPGEVVMEQLRRKYSPPTTEEPR